MCDIAVRAPTTKRKPLFDQDRHCHRRQGQQLHGIHNADHGGAVRYQTRDGRGHRQHRCADRGKQSNNHSAPDDLSAGEGSSFIHVTAHEKLCTKRQGHRPQRSEDNDTAHRHRIEERLVQRIFQSPFPPT
ncbi:Uncharacterised protein [Mycobacteroides abscessus subsp. abscessus]|nr:Uncharacterised protein [Mycobacteroides abscessus subsp. abscessus]